MENEKPKYTGYGYHGGGRPKGAFKTFSKRDRNIGIRVSEEELAMIKAKSAISGLGMTDFIIDCVKKA